MLKYLLLFLFPLNSFSQLILKVDNIIIKEPYEFPCFNYPNSIEINYSDYDSILFEGGEINYFDLKKEKMVTTKFKTNKININPSGELSAHYNSHTNPILIVFEKAIGYKNGASHNIKKINKSIEIKLKSISLLDDQEYKRINERSNLSLTINNELITNQLIKLDTVSMLNITHNKGYEFYKGNSIVAVLSEKGTPRPIWIINFKSIEELNELLKVKISNLDSDNKYCINFSLYYKDINDPSQREIESLFYLLIKK